MKFASFWDKTINWFSWKWYTSDIPQALSKSHTELYTDDVIIFYHYKNITERENVLNKEFVNVWDWFVDNKYQLIFVKIKLNAFFYAEKKNLPEFNIIRL